MNLSDCERILIVKPSSLGDIVHTLPAAAAIAATATGAKVDWLVNSEWLPLIKGAPFLHRAIPFPRRELRGIAGLFRGRAWANDNLRKTGYDLAVDFQGLFRSAYLARRSNACRVAGFRNSREGARWFYDLAVDVPDWDRCHAVHRNLRLAEEVGASSDAVEFPFPPGAPPAALPDPPPRSVILHPFSRGTGKSLSKAEIVEICVALAPLPVLLVGVAPFQAPLPENVVDLLGKTTLSELIHLIRRAAWTISVDSGPMHLAAGLTDRLLAIHTWSNPAMVGPCRPQAWIWREGQLIQVGGLDPAAFPERRDLAAGYESRGRILQPGDVERIAGFVHGQLA